MKNDEYGIKIMKKTKGIWKQIKFYTTTTLLPRKMT